MIATSLYLKWKHQKAGHPSVDTSQGKTGHLMEGEILVYDMIVNSKDKEILKKKLLIKTVQRHKLTRNVPGLEGKIAIHHNSLE
jgi:hypothetical protein